MCGDTCGLLDVWGYMMDVWGYMRALGCVGIHAGSWMCGESWLATKDL